MGKNYHDLSGGSLQGIKWWFDKPHSFCTCISKRKKQKFLLKRNSIQYLYELIIGLIKNILPIRGLALSQNTFTELKYQKYTLNIFIWQLNHWKRPNRKRTLPLLLIGLKFEMLMCTTGSTWRWVHCQLCYWESAKDNHQKGLRKVESHSSCLSLPFQTYTGIDAIWK